MEQERGMAFESAVADISVDTERKTVFIFFISAEIRGAGHGSGLLNEIKKKYPDFVISCNANPTDFSRPEKPTEEEMERAYDLGWDFARDRFSENPAADLTKKEKSLAQNVGERYRTWRESDPFALLHSFLRKNHFTSDNLSRWESKPPHKLRERVS